MRRLFVAPEQPKATRLQALEALIAFRDPALAGRATPTPWTGSSKHSEPPPGQLRRPDERRE